ncbi:hypothetical protein G6F68_011681 [Rhizopus microsporus]|nr:hypothetical protein G6F68_011681 [Rhizopus microsporus]
MSPRLFQVPGGATAACRSGRRKSDVPTLAGCCLPKSAADDDVPSTRRPSGCGALRPHHDRVPLADGLPGRRPVCTGRDLELPAARNADAPLAAIAAHLIRPGVRGGLRVAHRLAPLSGQALAARLPRLVARG